MGLSRLFSQEDIERQIQAFLDQKTQDMIRVFRFVGEQVIREVRLHGSYQDQTGNLRSSTGYMIAVDGIVKEDNFTGEMQGVQEGRSLAMANLPKEGIAIIVVAGMNYASNVESRGYNVITSGEQLAQQKIPQLLKMLI